MIRKNMLIDSPKTGRHEYSDADIITTVSGILGFEREKRYLLLETEKLKPFVWLQSEERTELAFLLIDPRLIVRDYSLGVQREDLSDLELKDGSETMVYAIVTIPPDPTQMTANLQGPLVFDLTGRKFQQLVIESAEVRHPIFQKDSACS
ncbi:MAG: flagellar assembly protein FliW [Planctomycetes bacterium]|nr:flagellar assembly protein FliW [Planctomycetota bacterium]